MLTVDGGNKKRRLLALQTADRSVLRNKETKSKLWMLSHFDKCSSTCKQKQPLFESSKSSSLSSSSLSSFHFLQPTTAKGHFSILFDSDESEGWRLSNFYRRDNCRQLLQPLHTPQQCWRAKSVLHKLNDTYFYFYLILSLHYYDVPTKKITFTLFSSSWSAQTVDPLSSQFVVFIKTISI